MLGEGPIYDIKGNFGSLEKAFCINFSKSSKNFIWAYITMVIIVICLLTEQKSLILKQVMEMIISTQFCLGKIWY